MATALLRARKAASVRASSGRMCVPPPPSCYAECVVVSDASQAGDADATGDATSLEEHVARMGVILLLLVSFPPPLPLPLLVLLLRATLAPPGVREPGGTPAYGL